MVFGQEVGNTETLPFHLEHAVAGSEVLNFGVHGYGLGQMVLRLEEEGFVLWPGHVVVGYLTYDLLRDPMVQYAHAKPAFEAGRLVIDNVPVPRDANLGWWARDSFVGAWLWERIQRLKQISTVEASLEITRALLERIRGACGERGVSLTLVHFIDGYTIKRMKTRDRAREEVDLIRGTLAGAGIDFLDLAPFLEERYADIGPSLLAPHGHWTGVGHRLIAVQLAAHLAR